MMGSDHHFRDKVPVAILGATGSVGQRFVELLATHPWFEIVYVAASERSAGKRYGEVVNWLMPTPIPAHIANMIIMPCVPDMSCPLIFSGLDSSVAGDIETEFASAGYIVVSNARNHRMQPDVPLLIPEVNASHLDLLKLQKFPKGKIITNPNCSTIGLSLALKPIHDAFGIKSAHVVTMQAVSGAGYPGISSIDIMDNVIPYINGEEQKIEQEPLKILGSFNKDIEHIHPAAIKISAQCNRVAVSDGHTECVSLSLNTKATPKDLIDAWHNYKGDVHKMGLPFAPKQPIYYFSEHNFPQPKLHRNLERGMAISIGRLRECPLMDYKFTLLSHNTIRGAAGGAILCAELLLNSGHIYW